MKQSRIDFAPRTFRRALALTARLTWLLAAIAVGLCLSVVLSAQHLIEQSRSELTMLNGLNIKLSQRATSIPEPKKSTISTAQATAVNAAIAQLNLPWRDLLDATEAATPKNIALLAMEPNANKSFVTGVAEAKTNGDMLAYIEQLKKQNYLDDVILTKHEINEQDPNRPLRFQFEARWHADAQ